MHWVYGIVGILAVLAGGLILVVAPAVTQQIAGILCVLLGFLLMAVADGIGRLAAIHRLLAENIASRQSRG